MFGKKELNEINYKLQSLIEAYKIDFKEMFEITKNLTRELKENIYITKSFNEETKETLKKLQKEAGDYARGIEYSTDLHLKQLGLQDKIKEQQEEIKKLNEKIIKIKEEYTNKLEEKLNEFNRAIEVKNNIIERKNMKILKLEKRLKNAI